MRDLKEGHRLSPRVLHDARQQIGGQRIRGGKAHPPRPAEQLRTRHSDKFRAMARLQGRKPYWVVGGEILRRHIGQYGRHGQDRDALHADRPGLDGKNIFRLIRRRRTPALHLKSIVRYRGPLRRGSARSARQEQR